MSTLALVACAASSHVSGSTVAAGSAAIEPIRVGGPTAIEVSAPRTVRAAGGEQLAQFRRGRSFTAQSGCLACHKIGDSGNRGPGSNLTHVGSMLSRSRIETALVKPTEPMPSFRRLPRAKFRAIVVFLSLLRP